jgi:hypothetical protein
LDIAPQLPAMQLARTILSLLIALSVAMLPIAGAAALPATSMDMPSMSASQATSTSEDMAEMPDCCPHDSKALDKSTNDCGCAASCVVTSFGLSAPLSSVFHFPPILATLAPSPASQPFHSETGSPPFRPPRA